MTEEECEQKIQKEFAECETFGDFRSLVISYNTRIGYNEAFERIRSAKDAFDLAWAAQEIYDDDLVTIALSKCLDLATFYDEDDVSNSLEHIIHQDHNRQFFHESIFQDAGLVKKIAKLHGLDM